MITEIYDIEGMHCSACAQAVERVTRKIPGVSKSSVNLILNRLTIVYDETRTGPDEITARVTKAGFAAKKHQGDAVSDAAPKKSRISLKILVMLTLAFITFLLSLPAIASHALNLCRILVFCASVPVLVLGRHFFSSGFRALFRGHPNMDSLVALSASVSYLYSIIVAVIQALGDANGYPVYFESAVMVIALVSLGKHLEANSTRKTRSLLDKLKSLAPDTALLVDGDNLRTVSIKDVHVGDILRVQTGMSVPVDGIVVSGQGHVNASMITGESLPVAKKAGENVIGGSILVDGSLTIEAKSVDQNTLFAQIVQYVEEAQGRKAPIARTVDKVAGIFVPAVLAIATLSAVIWAICGQPASFVLNIFTSVLVIACPCAMGLATPTAIIVGTGLGATHGILIRSGEALETCHKIDQVVFDKTGTLTRGTPSVTDILGDPHAVLSIAYALESHASHPFANAICEKARAQGIVPKALRDYQSLDGRGLSGQTDDGIVWIGSRRLMEENQIDTSRWDAECNRLRNEGKTTVFVAEAGSIIGIVGISDVLRDDAKDTIRELTRLGISSMMLTGDHETVVAAICQSAAIQNYRAEILPSQKADAIRALQESGHTVMMVGDGINDAPALTCADIGCAIASGTDIAIESAQIILLHNRLADVASAIRLSRLTMRKIRQNLFWAFFYNIIGIPIAAGALYSAFGILLSPMYCAAAMCMSSIFVVTNALRLRKSKI